MSFAYHPMIRITPTDGAARVLDLREEFPDTGGQDRTRVDYDFESEDYEDVNRRRRRVAHGIRCEVRLRFPLLDVSHHAALADIVTELIGDATVELSLDAGFTYREVVLVDAPSPRPLGRKTYIGASHEIRLECVELLDTMPSMSVAGGW